MSARKHRVYFLCELFRSHVKVQADKEYEMYHVTGIPQSSGNVGISELLHVP